AVGQLGALVRIAAVVVVLDLDLVLAVAGLDAPGRVDRLGPQVVAILGEGALGGGGPGDAERCADDEGRLIRAAGWCPAGWRSAGRRAASWRVAGGRPDREQCKQREMHASEH